MPDPLSALPPASLTPPAIADAAKLRQVAKQFEAVFVRELFKPLEKEPGEDGDALFGEDNATATWKSLQHQAMADQAAGNLGIAELVYRELALKAGLDPKPQRE